MPRIDFHDPDHDTGGGHGLVLRLEGCTDDPEWCARCRLFMVLVDNGGFQPGPAPDLGPTGWRRWYRRPFGDDGLFSG